MKKSLWLLVIFSILLSTAYSQLSDLECGTMEYLKKQFKDNPGLEKQFQEFEYQVQQWIKQNLYEKQDKLMTNITIPVVVHIIYYNEQENISDATVAEQLQITNNDFAGANTNPMGVFASYLKSSTGIQFELAKKASDGSSTSGIERRQSYVPFFEPNNDMKYYLKGGLDAWDPTRYFNIWVCPILRYAGYAQFPGTGVNSTFGVVIHSSCFGTYDDGRYRNLGATTTHEIGHCFNLRHIWADDNGACTGTDYVEDTPNQAYPTYYTWGGKVTDDCSNNTPGIMYMNFMDYSTDVCLSNFTPGQAERMQACFANSSSPLWSLSKSDAYIQPTNCETPNLFVLSFASKTTATIEWTAMIDADLYNVRYRKSGSNTWTNTSTTSNFKQLTGLSKNTSYEYQVQTVNGDCYSPFSDIKTFKTPNQDYSSSIGSVNLISPANNASDIEISQTLSWSNATNATSYILQISQYENFQTFNQVKITTTSYNVIGLEYNKIYYWRVKGCNPSYSGSWSQRTFSTLNPTLEKPTLNYPPRAGNIPVNIVFSWEPVQGATSYILQYSTDNFINYTQITTANTYAEVSNLSMRTYYQWRVRAINSNAFSMWSYEYFVTASSISNIIPQLSSPANESSGIILNPTFSWAPMTNATYYMMQYSTDNFQTIAGGVITSINTAYVSGLNANKTYYWRVRASIAESAVSTYFSSWSEIFTFTTESVSLATPTLVAPINGATNFSINPALSWNAVSGASGYNIEYYISGNQPIQTTTTGTTINLTGLSYNTTYSWKVQAVNGETLSVWSSVWSFTTESENLPAPTLVSPANNASKVTTNPTLVWNPVSGAIYYTAEFSTSSNFDQSISVTPIYGTSQIITNLAKNTNYYWHVKAVGQNLESPWSSTFKFKTSPTGKFYVEEFESGELEFDRNSMIVYPNPFSSATRIEIQLVQTEQIELKITDLFGRTVRELINGEKQSGGYQIDFDVSELESGIYFCIFKSGNFTQVIKLLIIR